MPHDVFDERLSAYLDNQLAPGEREEVEALLRSRPDLAQALEQVRQIGRGIQQLPRHSLGDEFSDRVVMAAQQAAGQAAPGTSSRSRRGWLMAVVSAVAATAAVVLAMFALRPRAENVVQPQTPILSPAEQAVAAALASAQEGQAVVVRLRLTKDAIRAKALDQALAANGISSASAAAKNPAAQEVAQGYKSMIGQAQGSGSAAEVLFIEAEPSKLQKALAAVAQTEQGMPAISTDGVIASTVAGLARSPKAEGEGGGYPPEVPLDPKNYAQHLPPRGFPLLKSNDKVSKVTSDKRTSKASGGKAARVLVVVEVIP